MISVVDNYITLIEILADFRQVFRYSNLVYCRLEAFKNILPNHCSLQIFGQKLINLCYWDEDVVCRQQSKNILDSTNRPRPLAHPPSPQYPIVHTFLMKRNGFELTSMGRLIFQASHQIQDNSSVGQRQILWFFNLQYFRARELQCLAVKCDDF